jgi:uncharacterized protein
MIKFNRIAFCLVLLVVSLTLSAVSFPKPTGWVNDFAGKMNQSTIDKLNSVVSELKSKTGVEIAVAIVPNLQGMDYENYTNLLYRDWGVGNSKNEGVLIMIAVQDRKAKLEVGYGSEGYLTDAISYKIFNEMKPYLSNGSYSQAVIIGVSKCATVIATEYDVTLSGNHSNKSQERKASIFPMIIFIILVIVTRGRILIWLMIFGGRGGFGGFGGGGRSGGGGGFGGFGGFGGGSSGGGGAGGSF